MLKATNYFKQKGKRGYQRMSTSTMKDSSINDYLKFFPTSAKKRNPDNEVRVKYSNFGRTFTRIVKNKKTGNSTMLVLKELW